MSAITLQALSHSYPGGVRSLDGVDLHVPAGECLVLLGLAGSGKSTLLRVVAGLEMASSGRVVLDGKDVTHLPPHARQVALVGQRALLYPHLSIRDNLAFAADRPDLAAAVELLDLGPLLDRRPDELSGGQQQRVALGRALVRRARVLLLDQPFDHLDSASRWELLVQLPLLSRQSGFTMVLVTHQQEEAFALADQVALIDQGRLLQAGAPALVHDRPNTVQAARLLGWPPINVLSGVVRLSADGCRFETGTIAFPLPASLNSWSRFASRPVLLGVRPDAGLALPLERARRVESAAGPLLVGRVGGQAVTVCDGVERAQVRTHLFDAHTGKALAHGSDLLA